MQTVSYTHLDVYKRQDITDLIQQFPELATETDNLQQGLQNLAFDKASDAIGKIRDSVKDVTDPKQLAAADKYIPVSYTHLMMIHGLKKK